MVIRELTAADVGDGVLLDLIRNDDPLACCRSIWTETPLAPVAARQSTSTTGLSNWRAT
jgi:hypothetical protein